MRDLSKINSKQVFGLWKNLTVCILAVAVTIILSKILPYYLSPVIALLVASALYFYIYNEKFATVKTCTVPAITILYNIVAYAFLTIILNLMHIWGLFEMPREFVFFTDPFIPSLILNPVSFVVLLIIYLQRKRLKACTDCRQRRSFGGRRGAAGVLNVEVHNQMKNFIVVSGILSLVIWFYYQFHYIDTNINSRDAYIFTGLTLIGLFLDWIYFSWRYYNLYLDLKENDELITPAEIRDMTAKTYVRYYVVCGNSLYLTPHAQEGGHEVLDTPFFTKQTLNGRLGEDAESIIKRMTGVDNGELKFFYGRKSPEDNKHSLLRYFYFLDGTPEDYPELDTEGEWIPFDKVKYIYSNMPQRMAELAVYDITRLATIILTEKIFDENGIRKSGIRSYNPTFNLPEVRKSKIDFQDDKWIEVSLFNSDARLFKLKKWWRNRFQKSRKNI